MIDSCRSTKVVLGRLVYSGNVLGCNASGVYKRCCASHNCFAVAGVSSGALSTSTAVRSSEGVRNALSHVICQEMRDDRLLGQQDRLGGISCRVAGRGPRDNQRRWRGLN